MYICTYVYKIKFKFLMKKKPHFKRQTSRVLMLQNARTKKEPAINVFVKRNPNKMYRKSIFYTTTMPHHFQSKL